jgi:hypothetical protein
LRKLAPPATEVKPLTALRATDAGRQTSATSQGGSREVNRGSFPMVVRTGRARMADMPRALKRTGHTPRAAEATTLAESGPARAHVAERQEARRRQILDAAGQLFYTKGYPGMTMNDLCRALGVTKPAVYYYFMTSTRSSTSCVASRRRPV